MDDVETFYNRSLSKIYMKSATSQLTTPVVFCIFNRPNETARVFEAIRKARPSKMYVVADGPRTASEKNLCDVTRKIIDSADWPCSVEKNYSDVNLGCKKRIASGLDWIFTHEAEAIILEDDCLPNENFFSYCETLLNQYRNDVRVFHISGSSFLKSPNQFGNDGDYYFSAIPQIWGWATWRRAWQKYDLTLSAWPEFQKTQRLKNIFGNPVVSEYWEYVFERMYQNKYDTWDIAWTFTIVHENALAITPKINLVSNIGYGTSATHTKNTRKGAHLANLPTYPIGIPLKNPPTVTRNIIADEYIFEQVFNIKNTPRKKMVSLLKKYLPKIYILLKKHLG